MTTTRGLATVAARVAALLAIASVLGGCTTRDRLNPLDPANSETNGAVPGFAAIAGNGLVDLRWTPLTQKGVEGYALHRWRPGGTPTAIPGAVFGPASSGTVDFGVVNDSTYLYRLVARFSYGDSAFSLPDSATPGARFILVLGADPSGIFALSPDGRDVISAIPSNNAYLNFDIDRDRNVLWLNDPGSGVILRRGLNGEVAGVALQIQGVTDVSVSNLRGIGWIASPELQLVRAFGPDLNDPAPRVTLSGVGHARVVAAGTLDATVWVGNDEGTVYRLSPSDGSALQEWSLGAPIRAIALDEAGPAAWVLTTRGRLNDLYYLVPGSPVPAPKRTGLDNAVDAQVEPISRTLWLSERGRPRTGAGRISRLASDGTTLATRTGLEPYGIGIEPGVDHVWVTDLLSNRLYELDANASIVHRSPPIGVPYGVIIQHP